MPIMHVVQMTTYYGDGADEQETEIFGPFASQPDAVTFIESIQDSYEGMVVKWTITRLSDPARSLRRYH